MDELIEALTIVRKYMDAYALRHPTGCEHDALWLNVDVKDISTTDLDQLAELSFRPDDAFAGSLVSTKFGSC